VSLAEKNEVPADCTVLIIAGPQKDFLTQEVDAIRKYVASGGRVLVFVDALADPRAQRPENLEKLLAEWNVTTQSDLVVDPSVRIIGAGPGFTIVRKYGSSPIVKPLEGSMTLFPMARSFEIGKGSKSGITDDWLCQTSEVGYGVADFSFKTSDVKFRAGKDLKGPMTLAVAGTISRSEGGKEPVSPLGTSSEGRFVAVGTSTLAANYYLHVAEFSNLDFLMGSIDWLASQEDMISIRPKPPESQHLTMTAEQMRRVLIMGVFGIPILIVMAGFLVWWQRR
jgi:ABC-type uncharacterized transport system involved in gliding motility auxiliary subunit